MNQNTINALVVLAIIALTVFIAMIPFILDACNPGFAEKDK